MLFLDLDKDQDRTGPRSRATGSATSGSGQWVAMGICGGYAKPLLHTTWIIHEQFIAGAGPS